MLEIWNSKENKNEKWNDKTGPYLGVVNANFNDSGTDGKLRASAFKWFLKFGN